MSYSRFLLRRLVVAAVSLYAVVTATFLLAELMMRKYLADILGRARRRHAHPFPGGATEAQQRAFERAFLETHGFDEPLYVRYADWLVDVTTLDWGYSRTFEAPVAEVLVGPLATTLSYVVPGVAVGILAGVLLGLAAALAKDSVADWAFRLVAYTSLALPAFLFVEYGAFGAALTGGPGLAAALVEGHPSMFAAGIVAASLLAGQLRFARTASLEQVGREFVTLLRAKGTSRLGVARHVLRNASLPIVSLSTSEVLAVLALDVYVIEYVLPLPGMADVVLVAAREGDVPVLIWSTLVVVVIGVLGNLLTDVVYGILDPRVRVG